MRGYEVFDKPSSSVFKVFPDLGSFVGRIIVGNNMQYPVLWVRFVKLFRKAI